ncbi:hypothetical protein KCV07_g7516, partial [Aureobasidium melanogenum]
MESTGPNNSAEFGLEPQQDRILALTALVSTISLATMDFRAGGQMLGQGKSALANALPPRVDVSLPKTSVLTESISRSYIRGATSCAFFYLAYKDYQTTQLRQQRSEDEDASAWRWKAWASCGAAGVLVQSLGPMPGGAWEGLHKPDSSVKGQAQRLGMLTMVKGGVLMATVPFCLSAWRSL